ncbi:hypothetical protein [Maribacter litoralis]|uniref:Uncharacterized protein n=1 Tax=Maribacter litoralis TaxID=2059726 RepID=A0A653LJ84_9FLAO|nr:hypothetical protein [Maribacter litoralis]VXA92427.1 conserved exported hypothetical protein [Maribacter litoralis]
MKNITHILVLSIMLLVIPTNAAFACGKSTEKEKTEKSSCSKEHRETKNKSCCDKENNDNGCDGACDHPACHCPTSVNTTVFYKSLKVQLNNNYKPLNIDWTYVQHFPKAVYLSIWQPPKIS